jgi:hypothetical protein
MEYKKAVGVEIKEAELLPLAGEKQCGCGVCNCSSDI